MKIFILAILFTGAVLNTVHLPAQTYTVKKIPAAKLHLTGEGNEQVWNKANLLTQFTYPWETEPAPATSFAALWDAEWLYLRYLVKDDSVNIYTEKKDKIGIGKSDRVEIFFAANDSLQPYYCLEMEVSGRVLDYNAAYYRKMNYEWQWPKGQLIIKSSRTKDGYVVEAAISIHSLKQLGLLQNNRLKAGLFRAECKSIINGKADLRWISWIKPASSEPDFHIPSAFGTFVLE